MRCARFSTQASGKVRSAAPATTSVGTLISSRRWVTEKSKTARAAARRRVCRFSATDSIRCRRMAGSTASLNAAVMRACATSSIEWLAMNCSDSFLASWASAGMPHTVLGEQQRRGRVRVVERELLRHHAAHRESEQMDAFGAEMAQQAHHVVRHVGDRPFAAGRARAAVSAQVDENGRHTAAQLRHLVEPDAAIGAQAVQEHDWRRSGVPRLRAIDELVVELDLSYPDVRHPGADENTPQAREQGIGGGSERERRQRRRGGCRSHSTSRSS